MSVSFSEDNLRFMMASNMEVIVPLLGDFMFLMSLVLCLTQEDLMECGLDGRDSAGGRSDDNRTDGSVSDGSGTDWSGSDGSGSDRIDADGIDSDDTALMGVDWYSVARLAVDLMAAAYVVE